MNRPRRIATVIHRWTGLAMALFLTIVGLTGATIAWNDELERIFAPSLFVLPAAAQQRPPLDLFALREAAERETGFAVNSVDWTRQPGQPVFFYLDAKPGGPEPHDGEIALDPSSGQLLGARRHGDLRQGIINLMPFIYELHYSLALGEGGTLVLGIVALLWTVDCCVGAYLTFPARAKEPRGLATWLQRWKPAWLVRSRKGRFKLFYDLHRAGGLWPWALMAIIAWSSVNFNLRQVYQPVMAATFGMAPDPPERRHADPIRAPRLGWREAHGVARHEMAKLGARKGFTVQSERLMFYDPSSHNYMYRVLSSRDPGETGNTQITLDGDTGRVTALSIPTGEYAGTTITTWIDDIHVGDVMGVAMRIALTLTGLAVASLSLTGVWLWWRKRSARVNRRRV